jgi:glutamate-5-semialdehyde dehydrogenase
MDDGELQLRQDMTALGVRARAAAYALGDTTAEARTAALIAFAAAIRAEADRLAATRAENRATGRPAGLAPAALDRLELTPARIEAIAQGVETVAAIPDPVGAELARWTQPNGLDIARVATPIGVIGVIFEARPNVTGDAAALGIRSGNAVILRPGSECHRSSARIAELARAACRSAGLPADAVQLVPTTDRAAVGELLAGLEGNLDLIIPRGGPSLVERVKREARVAVLGHAHGVNHTYVHAAADPEKALAVTLNGKMRRVGVCGATETLIIDAEIAGRLLPRIAEALTAAGCELRGDGRARALVPGMAPAAEADWSAEYLAPVLAVKVVDGLDDAVAHIARYGTSHTEAIVTEDVAAAEAFARKVDAAIVLINASTQFADGGEFGFGAEIGIATDRLHARGPVGAAQLTTFKYVVRGSGQTRP